MRRRETMLGKKDNMKNKIINLILNDRLLSAREMYKKIKIEACVSYQYVHKTMKELVEEKILLKEKRLYHLNPKWALELRNKLENYLRNEQEEITEGN